MSDSQNKIKVLIADDMVVMRQGLTAVLERLEDIEAVGCASTVQEAIRLVRDLQPDVVLMDLKWFSDESAGIYAIKIIRDSTPQTGIVALSAYGDSILSKALTAGASAALGKGCTIEKLADTIRSVAREPAPSTGLTGVIKQPAPHMGSTGVTGQEEPLDNLPLFVKQLVYRLKGILGLVSVPVVREPAQRIDLTGVSEQEESLDDLTLFVRALVHRLKNTLGLIPALTQELAVHLQDENLSSQRVTAILQEIENSAKEALAVLSRVSELSRPLSLDIADVNLLLDSALKAVSIPENVAVRTKYTDHPLPVVGGAQLTEVFINLITNALQAMPTGGTLDIRSELAPDGHYVDVRIADTGSGIPEEIRQHLFKAFVTSKEGGQGLGLWLSKQIVQRLGGDIYVQSSAANVGTTFVVRLPLHKG